jgi:RNAse (barnase) inhibitor barstar
MNERSRTPLAKLPSHAVTSRGLLDVEALRDWAEQNGQRFVRADLSGCKDRTEVLREIGRALAFPEWYGANLDALFDCLTDLAEPGASGFVVVLDHLPRPPALEAGQRARLLDVFRDALVPFVAAGVPLRVFYR